MVTTKQEIIRQLQKDILRLQGIRSADSSAQQTFGLGAIEQAFPNSIIPTATIHEFLCFEPEHKAAGSGFITGMLSTLMQNGGACIWISKSRTLFPMGLSTFGIVPDHLIFVDVERDKDILWAAEEALKCDGLAAVVTELSEMTFTQSRRLQLAVEQSKVTGFILRTDELKLNTSACAARWQVTSLPSQLADDMPGVGFSRWNVELLKVRNGNPGAWQVEWRAGKFIQLSEQNISDQEHTLTRKAG